MRHTSLGSRQHWTRRLIYTAVIVAVAVGLAWWGSKRETSRFEAIRGTIITLIDSFSDGQPVTWQSDLASPTVGDSVMQRIRSLAMTIPDGDDTAIRIDVAPEGLAPFERGEATHQAVIYLYDRPELGLLFEAGAGADSVLIVGYWEPAAP